MRKNRRGAIKHPGKEMGTMGSRNFPFWLKDPGRSLGSYKRHIQKTLCCHQLRTKELCQDLTGGGTGLSPHAQSVWEGVWVQMTHGTLKTSVPFRINITLLFHKVPHWLPFPGPTVTITPWPGPACFPDPSSALMSVSRVGCSSAAGVPGLTGRPSPFMLTDWKGQELYQPKTPCALCYAYVYGLETPRNFFLTPDH